MMDWLSSSRALFVLRMIVGGIFLYAGILKLAAPLEFADAVATFRMLPPELINVLALALPPFEVILGLLMISGWRWRPAALGILMLTVVFAAALGQALIRGLEVDCGCFGHGEPSVVQTWNALGRDLLILSAAAWLYWCSMFRAGAGGGGRGQGAAYDT